MNLWRRCWLIGAVVTLVGGGLSVAPVAADPAPAAAAPARSAPAPSAAAVSCATQRFWDVPRTHQFCREIDWLASTGVTTGYHDEGQALQGFHPVASVTRQAMAAFLHRYGFQGQSDPVCAGSFRMFKDVPTGGFCGSIEWLAGAGVTGGYADGGFHPTAPVSRQAMAAFLYRFAHPGQAAPACSKQEFWDVPIGDAFCPQISWLAASGVTTGYHDGKSLPGFHPTAAVTRQAMAAFLNRADAGDVIALDTATPLPTVTGVSPASGYAAGGTTVTVTGTNLTGVSKVLFDSPGTANPAAGTAVTVVSASQLTVKTPAHAVGAVPVRVVNATGTSVPGVATFGYVQAPPAPTIASISPASGPVTGGTTVTVTGTNLTDASAVKFGPAAGTAVTVLSATRLTVNSPAGSVGVVDISVTTPSGTATTTAGHGFTYTAPPTTADWTQSDHDAQHTGWAPNETVINSVNAGTVAEEWSVAGGGATAVADGVLYVSAPGQLGGSNLVAYDLGSGAVLWSIPTDTCIGNDVLVTSTLLIVGCAAPRAYARAGTHALVWDIAETDPGQSLSDYQLVGATLVGWSSNGTAAFQLSDGQRVWQQLVPAGAGSVRDVAATESTVIVAYDDRLRALSTATGAQQWSLAVISARLVISDGWVYTNNGNGVSRYAVSTGAAGWSVLADHDIYRIEAADADTVYAWEAKFDFASPYPSVLHALRTSNGSERWQVDVPSRIGQVAIAGDVVWLTSTGIYSQEHASDLIAVNRATGAQLRRISYQDNMYGYRAGSFSGGKVILDQGGSYAGNQPRVLRVLGLSGPMPQVSTSVLPMGRVGSTYSADLAATPAGATWSVRSGALPAGITLSTSGHLGGSPTTAGMNSVVFRATGSNGRTSDIPLLLEVVANDSAPWSTAGRDATRNPFTAGDGTVGLDTAPTFAFRWKTSTPTEIVAGSGLDVAASGTRMYATSVDGKLQAWDTTGNTTNRAAVWTASGTFSGPPSLAGDRLIARTEDGKMHGIRLSDGAELWRTANYVWTAASGNVAPLVVGSTFFMFDSNYAVVAYSTVDGSRLWAQPGGTAKNIYRNLSSDGTRLYGVADCELVALRVTDGAELWRTTVTPAANCGAIYSDNGPPLVLDGRVYAATQSNRLVADAVTGAPLLRFDASGYQEGHSVVAGGLWIFGVDGHVVAVDTVTGRIAWQGADYGDDLRISVVGDLVVVSTAFQIVGLSRLTGEKVWDGGSISAFGVGGSPVIAGKRIFLITRDGVRAYGPL